MDPRQTEIERDDCIVEFKLYCKLRYIDGNLVLPTLEAFQEAFNSVPEVRSSGRLVQQKKIQVLSVFTECNYPHAKQMGDNWAVNHNRLTMFPEMFIQLGSVEDVAHVLYHRQRWSVKFLDTIVDVTFSPPTDNFVTRKTYREIAPMLKRLEGIDKTLESFGAVAANDHHIGMIILPYWLTDKAEFDEKYKSFQDLMQAVDPMVIKKAGFSDVSAVKKQFHVYLCTHVKVDRVALQKSVDEWSAKRFELVVSLAAYDQSKFPFMYNRAFANTKCRWTW